MKFKYMHCASKTVKEHQKRLDGKALLHKLSIYKSQ